MVYTQSVVMDDRQFTLTRSDKFMIRKIGTDEIYSEAYDVLPYEYEETDTPLPDDGDPNAAQVRDDAQGVEAEHGKEVPEVASE